MHFNFVSMTPNSSNLLLSLLFFAEEEGYYFKLSGKTLNAAKHLISCSFDSKNGSHFNLWFKTVINSKPLL